MKITNNKSSNLRATHQGKINIGTISLDCYVLESGERVLSGRGVQKSFGLRSEQSGNQLIKIIYDPSLKELLTDSLKEIIKNRIEFLRKGAGGSAPVTYGYDATILPEICSLILEANDSGLLNQKYEFMVKSANILLRSFAKLGIIALIDEATGYQLERERDELQKILSAYISKELLPWQKRFPDEFYNQIYRLKGWGKDPIKQRTPYLGKITNDVIYGLLPPGVLKELRKKNPIIEKQRKFKHHQFLTDDIGNKHLQQQLTEVITLMRISDDWDEFEANMFKAFENYGKGQQLTLPFPKDVVAVKALFDKAINKASKIN